MSDGKFNLFYVFFVPAFFTFVAIAQYFIEKKYKDLGANVFLIKLSVIGYFIAILPFCINMFEIRSFYGPFASGKVMVWPVGISNLLANYPAKAYENIPKFKQDRFWKMQDRVTNANTIAERNNALISIRNDIENNKEMWSIVNNSQHINYTGNFILFSALIVFIINKMFNKFLPRYLPCPSCKKSVGIYCDWQCDHCNNYQGKKRFIFAKCNHCKRRLELVYCEHCHKEIPL